MRWSNLFDDLESQLEHGLTAEEADLQAEEERLRQGRLLLRERMLALHGSHPQRDSRALFDVVLTDGSKRTVRPTTFGEDWFAADLIDGSQRNSQCVIPMAAVAEVLLGQSQIQESLHLTLAAGLGRGRAGRLGLVFVLRDLCRRRQPLEAHMLDGVLHGTIDRVGRDHFDLAVHEPGTMRRDRDVSQYRLLSLNRLALLRV
ncbi:MAG: hypothetical protein ACYCZK_00420 [Microbacteriaceae bacterium]